MQQLSQLLSCSLGSTKRQLPAVDIFVTAQFCVFLYQACYLHASIVAYAAVDCCSFIMHYTCDRYTLTKRIITAGMYNFAGNCMKRVFAALQLLQMMQQPNRYEGIGNRAKVHRPEQCDEPATRRTKQEAKKKAISSAERIGSKASSSSAHQPISPMHRLTKLADQGGSVL